MMSPWTRVSRMSSCLSSYKVAFLLQRPLFPGSSLLYFDVLVTPWKTCLLQSSEGLNTLPKVSGQTLSSGKMEVKHLQDCAERHVNLGTWICQRRQLKHCLLPSVSPAPRVSRIRPHSHCPCVCSLPLLSPLLTLVVKIWKGCTGILIIHLTFFM